MIKTHLSMPVISKLSMAISIVFFLVSMQGSELMAQPDDIWLDHPASYSRKQRTAVFFPHTQHMEEMDCLDCHHDYENGDNILSPDDLEEGEPEALCTSCHHPQASINLRKAFHRQCIGCHRDHARQGFEVGPRLCAECHPWNKDL